MVVTVEHGHARLTLSLPEDVAVESLLPELVDRCGDDPTASWALVPAGGEPLESRRTLAQAGVLPGALLALRMLGPGERPPRWAGWGPSVPGVPRRLLGPHRLVLALLAAGDDGVLASWRATAHTARLERAVAEAPRARGVAIAVAAVQPAAGATTVAALLCAQLARALAEPPLAIDGDLDERSLSRHLAPRLRLPAEAYRELVGGRLRLGELASAGHGPHGVALLPAPDPPGPALDAAECAALVPRLAAEGRVVVLDCPGGFRTPWGQAAWAAADQVVLVADARVADAAPAASVAARLAGTGVPVALVANHARIGSRGVRALTALGLHAPVVRLAHDPHTAARLRDGQLTWEAMPGGWRRAAALLAAALAVRWPRA